MPRARARLDESVGRRASQRRPALGVLVMSAKTTRGANSCDAARTALYLSTAVAPACTLLIYLEYTRCELPIRDRGGGAPMVSSFCATLARRRAARVRVGPAVLFVRHGVCAWAYGVSFAASELCTFSFISSKATKFPIDHLQRIKVNYYLYHVTVWSVCPTKLILKVVRESQAQTGRSAAEEALS